MLPANDVIPLNSEGSFFLNVIFFMPRKWSQQDGAACFNFVGERTIGCSIQSFFLIFRDQWAHLCVETVDR